MSEENEKAARQLQDVRQWAKDKIATGTEPPWAWYQYMKLIDAADAILSGTGTVATTESSRQLPEHQGEHLRRVDSTYRQENAQHHSSDLPVLMPM